MAEVQPEYIGAGVEELRDRIEIGSRGAEGRDDLCFAWADHE
jgi:hypothetical protein